MLSKFGSGYGIKIINNRKDVFRLELGLGAALFFADGRNQGFFDFSNLGLYANYPIVPSIRTNIKCIIPLNKKS